MASPSVTHLTQHFSNLTDPRVERTKEHLLLDIVVIAICAILAGADGWVAVEVFGHAKEKWLRTFLELPNGIPSHDTFGRVFAALDPFEFQQSFLSWIEAVSERLKGEIVAVDGKTLRRSHDKGLGQNAIHMVSAWATGQRLVLGQRKIDDKSNEITALPELLRVLALEGCIVTVDALGCQTDIAETIVNQGAEYVLAVKENQGKLHEDLSMMAQPSGCAKRLVRWGGGRTISGGAACPRPPSDQRPWTPRNSRLLGHYRSRILGLCASPRSLEKSTFLNSHSYRGAARTETQRRNALLHQ
jgi:hypothetical protein